MLYYNVIDFIEWFCEGCGMTCPDPEGKLTLPDGVEVPMGKGVDSTTGQSSLLYNEYPLKRVNNTIFV